MTGSVIWAVAALRLRLNRGYLAFQAAVDLAIPVAYALLVSGADPMATPSRLATGALLASATLSILRMPATVMINERLMGVDELLSAAGVARWHKLAANALAAVYFLAFPLAALAITAYLLGAAFPLAPMYWLSFLLFILALHGGALLLAEMIRSIGVFTLALNFLLMVTTIVCPIYFSLDQVPAVIRPVIALLPPSLASELCADALAGRPPEWAELAALAAWAAGFLAIGHAYSSGSSHVRT